MKPIHIFLAAIVPIWGIQAAAYIVHAQGAVEPILVTAIAPSPGLNAFGNLGMEVLGWVLSAGVTVITGFASAWLHKARIFQANQDQAMLSQRLDKIVFQGIDLAKVAQQNEAEKKGSGVSEVKFDNAFLSIATGFVERRAPELLKGFGWDKADVNESIMLRLAPELGSGLIAGGIATPPAVTAAKAEAGRSESFSLPSTRA